MLQYTRAPMLVKFTSQAIRNNDNFHRYVGEQSLHHIAQYSRKQQVFHPFCSFYSGPVQDAGVWSWLSCWNFVNPRRERIVSLVRICSWLLVLFIIYTRGVGCAQYLPVTWSEPSFPLQFFPAQKQVLLNCSTLRISELEIPWEMPVRRARGRWSWGVSYGFKNIPRLIPSSVYMGNVHLLADEEGWLVRKLVKTRIDP